MCTCIPLCFSTGRDAQMLCMLTPRGFILASRRHKIAHKSPASMQRHTHSVCPFQEKTQMHIAPSPAKQRVNQPTFPPPHSVPSLPHCHHQHLTPQSVPPRSCLPARRTSPCTDVSANLVVNVSPVLYRPAKRCPKLLSASRRLIVTRCRSRLIHPLFDPNHALDLPLDC